MVHQLLYPTAEALAGGVERLRAARNARTRGQSRTTRRVHGAAARHPTPDERGLDVLEGLMLSRKRILAALDDATDMKRTVEVACRVAKARGADVEVIRVVPPRAEPSDDRRGVRPLVFYDDSGAGTGARLAAILRASEDDGVHVRSVTLQGTPEHVIPAYSQLQEAMLLVVQQDYGSSWFWRNGRVVDDLTRQSPVPVLVIPKRETRARDRSGLRRIVTAVDFTIASAVALKATADLARRHGARVTLVHALGGVPGHMALSGGEAVTLVRRLRAHRNAAAGRLRRKAASLGLIDVDTNVTTGQVESAILDVVARTGADLLVMGIAHRSSFDRALLGSTLRRVLRRAHVPVLAIPVVAGAHAWLDEYGVDRMSRDRWAEAAIDRVSA